MFSQPPIDHGHPIEMTERVLRHRLRPAEDAIEQRLGGDAQHITQFVTHHLQQFVIGAIEHIVIARAADKGADETITVRRAMRKLRRSPRARQNRSAFRARNNVAVSVQRLRNVAERIGDRQCHGRSIGNAAQCRCHFGIEIADRAGQSRRPVWRESRRRPQAFRRFRDIPSPRPSPWQGEGVLPSP